MFSLRPAPHPPVDRIACIFLPAFPLQLLRARTPADAAHPMVVVDRDHPGGRVLFVNQRAWAARIRPGMRFAAALSICGDLRAGVVDPAEVDDGIARVVEVLRAYSPAIEPAPDRPGVLWIDAGGLHRIYASPAAWLHELLAAIDAIGFMAHGVLGTSRFGTWALAHVPPQTRILADAVEERRAVALVPLERLSLPDSLRAALERFDLRTVGDLVAMPPDGLRERLGPDAWALWRQATDGSPLPVRGVRESEVPCAEIDLDHRETDIARLMELVRRELGPLLARLEACGQQAVSIRAVLRLDDRRVVDEAVRPATPTLDEAVLLDLLRLRLERCPLSAGVVRVMLVLIGAPVEHRQARLLLEHTRRDLDAAARAIARVAADLGDDAVGRLAVADGHLPEARWRWTPARTVERPDPARDAADPGLVRRVRLRPVPLPPRPRLEPDGWLVAGHEAGPVLRSAGPWVVAGGWWAHEIHREYFYVETRRGDLLWVFYDRRRRAWFQQGEIR
jgi:protein ImuB